MAPDFDATPKDFRNTCVMRLLLDTHVFSMVGRGCAGIVAQGTGVIADSENQCLLSLVSSWEMAVKLSLGKLRLPMLSSASFRNSSRPMDSANCKSIFVM